jgi:hypothetical protein
MTSVEQAAFIFLAIGVVGNGVAYMLHLWKWHR